jgi:hypothetical protein
MLLSRRRTGACNVVHWNTELGHYRCSALETPEAVLELALPRTLRLLAARLAPVLGRLARRWIAAGSGCDCMLEPHD